jgi:hypothetical protein
MISDAMSDKCTGDNQLIGRKASNIYRDGEPESAQLTISSLMFVNGEKGCEVRDFS